MRPWLKIVLVFFALLAMSACVSTGAREITQPDTLGRLETGKSTKAEVTALLGFPVLVTYGRQRRGDLGLLLRHGIPPGRRFRPRGGCPVAGFQADHQGVDGQFRSPGSGPKSPEEPDDRQGGDLSLLGPGRRSPTLPPSSPRPQRCRPSLLNKSCFKLSAQPPIKTRVFIFPQI